MEGLLCQIRQLFYNIWNTKKRENEREKECNISFFQRGINKDICIGAYDWN